MSSRFYGAAVVAITASTVAPVAVGQLSHFDETAAVVREPASLNGGMLSGNLHLSGPGSLTITRGFTGEGLILLAGQPDLRVHPRANVGSVEEGEGAHDPADYVVRIIGSRFCPDGGLGR